MKIENFWNESQDAILESISGTETLNELFNRRKTQSAYFNLTLFFNEWLDWNNLSRYLGTKSEHAESGGDTWENGAQVVKKDERAVPMKPGDTVKFKSGGDLRRAGREIGVNINVEDKDLARIGGKVIGTGASVHGISVVGVQVGNRKVSIPAALLEVEQE